VLGELLVRFLIGGLAVSLFSIVGEAWSPKTFSGLFGAAPSVAIASLAITTITTGTHEVAVSARWMLAGCIAMAAYMTTCYALCRRARAPMWLTGGLGWIAWITVAAGSWWLLRGAGAS
jgi:uncharacterized membrane protein (GlpM family)